MRILPLLTAATLAHGVAFAACPQQGQLDTLRAAKWEVADDAARQQLAINMLDCLSEPDPQIRDGSGFESLQLWMRAQKIDTITMQALRSRLLARLATPDRAGFGQPFAALVLAEVVRADRVKPYLTAAQRSEIANAATSYLAGVRDYRGFDQKEGWRHGVAHGADLMLQLAVNPATGAEEQGRIIAAIAAQLAAASAQPHFFQYGEGERLMAPVFYLARRDTLRTSQWEAWFAALAGSASGPATQTTLARRHNLKSFLQPLYVSLAESRDVAQRERMLPFVTKALRQLD